MTDRVRSALRVGLVGQLEEVGILIWFLNENDIGVLSHPLPCQTGRKRNT